LLCNGPGKLCQALGITKALDGRPMPTSQVVLWPPAETTGGEHISAGVRIGITKAADWPLRYVLAGSPWLSRP
jgi:DNA-3-methyladenine glycosylase